MGIKDIVRNLRNQEESGPGRGLALTDAARAGIESNLEAHDGDSPIAFFVLTRASEIGFDVGVGFDRVDAAPDRPLRTEMPVPCAVSDADWERLDGYTIDYRDGRYVVFSDVRVHVDDTPNPDSRKFMVNRDLMREGTATFLQRDAVPASPVLVRMLLEAEGVRQLFVAKGFVSVTRDSGVAWEVLTPEIGRRLQQYFTHGGAPLDPPQVDLETYTDIERKIVTVLQDVVRPAVQRDGGDIAFAGYEDGVVQVYMLGSCVGCPSSTATLKMGIEKLLKDQVSEIREVVSIS